MVTVLSDGLSDGLAIMTLTDKCKDYLERSYLGLNGINPHSAVFLGCYIS